MIVDRKEIDKEQASSLKNVEAVATSDEREFDGRLFRNSISSVDRCRLIHCRLQFERGGEKGEGREVVRVACLWAEIKWTVGKRVWEISQAIGMLSKSLSDLSQRVARRRR